MADVVVPDYSGNFINAFEAGQNNMQRMRQRRANQTAANAFSAGRYDEAEGALLREGMIAEAGQYGELGDRRRTRATRGAVSTAMQQAPAGSTPAQVVQAGADAALQQNDPDAYLNMLQTSGQLSDQAIARTQQAAQALAAQALQFQSLPEDQRGPAAIQALQSMGVNDPSIVARINQMNADGRITNEELQNFATSTMTFAEQVAERWNQRNFDENQRQFNESNRVQWAQVNASRGGEGRSRGYRAPTAGELRTFDTIQQQAARAGAGLESLREARSVIEQLVAGNHFGNPTPETARRQLSQLGSTNENMRGLFERLSVETWQSVLANLEGLQPISEAELNEARSRVANGDWTAEAALNWIRRMEEKARRANAIADAQLEWGGTNGSMTTGRDDQGRSFNEVRGGIERVYDQWGALSQVASPQHGREYVVPRTGDVFRYDANNRTRPWEFVRSGGRAESGRGVGANYNGNEAPRGGWPRPTQAHIEALRARSHDPTAQAAFQAQYGREALVNALNQNEREGTSTNRTGERMLDVRPGVL